MSNGCIGSLALLGLLTLAFETWLGRTLDPVGAWVFALILSLFAMAGLAMLRDAWRSRQSIRALRRSQIGEVPSHGEWGCIAGTIRADGPLVKTPFSERPCVLYAYQVTRMALVSSNQEQRLESVVDFAGVGMSEFSVEQGALSFSILGLPDFENVPEQPVTDPASRGKLESYVRETEWEDHSGRQLLQGSQELQEKVRAVTPSLRHDWRMASPDVCPWIVEEEEPVGAVSYQPNLFERCVREGAPVVVFGRYDAESQGLTPHHSTDGRRPQLFPGSAQEVEQQLSLRTKRLFWSGVVLFLVLFGVTSLGLAGYRKMEKTQRRWETQTRIAVRQGNAKGVRRLLERGADPNRVSKAGRTYLMESQSEEVSRTLIEHGAKLNTPDEHGNTALVYAVQRDQLEMVELLIEAGADFRIENRWNQSPLEVAIVTGSQRSERYLRGLGAELTPAPPGARPIPDRPRRVPPRPKAR